MIKPQLGDRFTLTLVYQDQIWMLNAFALKEYAAKRNGQWKILIFVEVRLAIIFSK